MNARPPALLVEDDETFVEALRKALDARGLEFDLAEEWDEGLELFRVNGYELVIADYNLPDTEHGLKLLVRMKMVIPSTRLVLISGALTPSAERSLKDVDIIDAYHSKQDANLTARLAEHIEQAGRDADNETDWRAVGTGYVAGLERDFPEVEKIDQILRADVERRRG